MTPGNFPLIFEVAATFSQFQKTIFLYYFRVLISLALEKLGIEHLLYSAASVDSKDSDWFPERLLNLAKENNPNIITSGLFYRAKELAYILLFTDHCFFIVYQCFLLKTVAVTFKFTKPSPFLCGDIYLFNRIPGTARICNRMFNTFTAFCNFFKSLIIEIL